MKSIVFHSYKGGTGRTMAVANFAFALAKAGKSVLVVDLDFDAPGLSSKFGVDSKVSGGFVDYLTLLSAEARISEDTKVQRSAVLKKLAVEVEAPNGKLVLLPAGNVWSSSYYSKVASEELHRCFNIAGSEATSKDFNEDSLGQTNLRAFLQDILDFADVFDQPDFCLVDCRAAHETASVAMLAWADEVIEFFPCNREGVFGFLLVAKMLHSVPGVGALPKLTPVVTRIPSDATQELLVARLREIISGFHIQYGSVETDLLNKVHFVREQRTFELGDDLVFNMENKSEHNLSYDYAVLLGRVSSINVEVDQQWETILELKRGDELFEKTFRFMHKDGVLLNSDDQQNVALRRETLAKLIESITNDQISALREFDIKDHEAEQLIAQGFIDAGKNAGAAFGLEAQQPGRVWPVDGVPNSVLKRLQEWCEFDREAGFGDWIPSYDSEKRSGNLFITNHFLTETLMGHYFIAGYVEGVLSYLVTAHPWRITKMDVKQVTASPSGSLNLKFSYD